jgi:hypothetical protein
MMYFGFVVGLDNTILVLPIPNSEPGPPPYERRIWGSALISFRPKNIELGEEF